jgi:hypothetical protein
MTAKSKLRPLRALMSSSATIISCPSDLHEAETENLDGMNEAGPDPDVTNKRRKHTIDRTTTMLKEEARAILFGIEGVSCLIDDTGFIGW